MEPWQETNNVLGEQLAALIEQLHGKSWPFILIMAPMDDVSEAQLVTNVDNIEFIQQTLRYLDRSLESVNKLENVDSSVQ